jgi:hypothetical protein
MRVCLVSSAAQPVHPESPCSGGMTSGWASTDRWCPWWSSPVASVSRGSGALKRLVELGIDGRASR